MARIAFKELFLLYYKDSQRDKSIRNKLLRLQNLISSTLIACLHSQDLYSISNSQANSFEIQNAQNQYLLGKEVLLSVTCSHNLIHRKNMHVLYPIFLL